MHKQYSAPCGRTFRQIRHLAVCAIALVIAGCDGLSDVGEQEDTPPQAVVTVVGHPFTTSASGAATTVRSQGEVTLTAKDSVELSAPILDFVFRQTDSNAPVAFLIRNRNTIAFTAPTVTQDTEYRFSLTVRDSQGLEDTTTATVLVRPVLDINHFLEYLNANTNYTIVAAAQTTVPGASSAPVDATLGEFTITIRRLLSYTPRRGPPRITDVALDSTPTLINGAWLQQMGASSSCTAAENPRFVLPIPTFDADDINLLVQGRDRTEQLELADIDDAELTLEISIAPTSGTVTPSVCVIDQAAIPVRVIRQNTRHGMLSAAAAALGAGAAPSVTVGIDELRGEPTTAQDTLESARAYYRTIGEETTKTTLSAWLDANGFNRSATDFGADAHVVYTNNFDLGFGRDMYLKVGDCDSPNLDVGACDVAFVVINFPSLEAAGKKLGPINAVAMEYSDTPDLPGQRIVKFYAYAPNPNSTTGEFTRIHSVNLDARGERYMPGSCTVCHSGTPGGLETNGSGRYTNNGDLNSAFLLWDLDTLLFSDTDQSFSREAGDTALRNRLVRSAQEVQFRRMNAGAYLTYWDRVPGRFALARELAQGWYDGVATLPASGLDQVFRGSTHFGAFVPPGWQQAGLDQVAGTADDNPAPASATVQDGSADIYSSVFAPHCRSCHVMQIPNPALADVRQEALCDDDPLTGDPISSEAQRPMGCYWQFVQTPNLVGRLSEGAMPFARLTMDRLWVPGSSGPSPGDQALAHLARADVLGEQGTVPGTPAADIQVSPAEGDEIDFNSDVLLQPSAARFATSFSWSVDRCTQVGDPTSCTIPVAVVGPASSSAAMRVTGFGDHRVELRVNGQADPIATQTFNVQDVAPLAQNQSGDVQIGNSTTFQLAQLLQNQGEGNGPLTAHTLTVESVSGANTVLGQDGQGVPNISITPTLLQPGTATVAFRVTDIDGDSCVEQLTGGVCPTRTISINATASIAAAALTRVVNANSGASAMTLLAGNGYGSRTDLQVQFQRRAGGNVVRNFNNSAATTAFIGGQTDVNYTPPIRVATQNEIGGNILTPDQFEYRLERLVNGSVVEISNWANLDVPIRATVSFGGDVVAGVFRNVNGPNCAQAGCHTASHPVIDLSPTNGNLYNSIRFGSGPTNGAFVTLSNPAGSGIYCTPLSGGSCAHGGTSFTAGELASILSWINQGANNF